MTVYHTSEMATHETRAVEYVSAPPNPYAYEVIPPIGRLLDLICQHLSVGGCFRPGNRQLADWLGYASAGQMPQLLSQLACDGWISYDRESRLIMLLRRPEAIDPTDRRSADPIDRSLIESIDQRSAGQIETDESALIDRIDRDVPQQDAEVDPIDPIDQLAPRMEDHVLVAATETQDSAAVRYKIPCSADSISPIDHPDPRIVLLSELGADPKIIADALSARPDLSLAQIHATWAHFAPRIRAGLCTAGAFFKAMRRGQLHTPPPDPDRPLAPEEYADRPGFVLGSDLPPPDEPEPIRDRALRLLPKPTPETLRNHTRDWMFLQGRLGAGDSDDQALAALEKHRSAVRR